MRGISETFKTKQNKTKRHSLWLAFIAVGTLNAPTFDAEAALSSYIGGGGVGLVYSSVSDVTWTADANLLHTLESTLGYDNVVNAIIAVSPTINNIPNTFDTPEYSGAHSLTSNDFYIDGLMTWWGAKGFISYLNNQNFGGTNQWALPTAGNNPQVGYSQTTSPLGKLYYNELGGLGSINLQNGNLQDGNMPIDQIHFINQREWNYSLGTEYTPVSGFAWGFATNTGLQEEVAKSNYSYTWPVISGQLTPVPLPAPLWLFGSGLITLLGFKKRKISK